MTTIELDIPNDITKNIGTKFSKHLNIVELFKIFGIDIEYVMKERQYSQDFLKNINENDFVIGNKF